ncbi:MAG: hypothetical protein ACFE7R_01605 [Candidatus Hodarchaeota archaeon]
MEVINDIRTWLWILKYWVVLFPIFTAFGILLGTFFNPSFFWTGFIIGIPLTVIPLTYRKLVGGGCSLRFQICALVKGMVVGFVFLILSFIADALLWPVIGAYIGWTPQLQTTLASLIYQLWFFGGTFGGFAARIVEVRGYSTDPETTYTISSFE